MTRTSTTEDHRELQPKGGEDAQPAQRASTQKTGLDSPAQPRVKLSQFYRTSPVKMRGSFTSLNARLPTCNMWANQFNP